MLQNLQDLSCVSLNSMSIYEEKSDKIYSQYKVIMRTKDIAPPRPPKSHGGTPSPKMAQPEMKYVSEGGKTISNFKFMCSPIHKCIATIEQIILRNIRQLIHSLLHWGFNHACDTLVYSKYQLSQLIN